MNKIAFYTRVSTLETQKTERQVHDLYALKNFPNHNFKEEEVDVYEEKMSGYEDDRPLLKEILDKINSDQNYYKAIYVTEISRLGRSPKKIKNVLWFLEEKKVNLFILKGNLWLLDNDTLSTNSYGKLILDIMINLADEEVRTLKERTKSGILSSIKAGNVGGGKFVPYGFTSKNKKLIIEENEAKIIEMIYNLYKSGNGVKVIAGILNQKKIPSRANIAFGEKKVNKKTGKLGNEVVWSDKTVNDILLNPIYKGKRRYWGGKENRNSGKEPELFDMELEKIITPELWDECMEIRKTKTHRNYLTEYVYLLKDKLICGVCGRNYFAKYKPVRGGDKVYICSSRLIKNGNCGNLGVNISLIESSIYNEIVDSDSFLAHLNKIDEIKKNIEIEIETLNNTIESTDNELKKLNKEYEVTLDLLIEAKTKGNISRIKKLDNKIEQFESKIKNNEKLSKKAKSRLVLTNNALKNESNLKTTTEKIINYKNNRVKLRSVYLQFIEKIIINVVNEKIVLANVFISLEGVSLPNTLKLFLDISGIRKANKIFRYMPIDSDELKNKLIYDENQKLITPISKIQNELDIIHENYGLLPFQWIIIDDDRILIIPEK